MLASHTERTMELGLADRVALVAGASTGIGAAVARRLGAEGAAVAVLARSAEGVERVATEIQAAGGRASPVVADVRDQAAVDAALDRVRAELGPPSIVVWSIATRFTHGRLPQVADDEIASMIDSDLVAAMRLARRLIPPMMLGKFGRFVFLSSVAATMGIPGGAPYAVTKAGLEGLARAITVDHGRYGVVANALRLGFVDTERLKFRRPDEADREALARHTATRKVADPDDVAAIATFLCSPLARSIAGAVLDVDDGVHLAGVR